MADVLLAWELGAGLGHLTVLRPIAERLIADGHRAHIATRELTAAETVFPDLHVERYQSPIKIGKPIAPIRDPIGYAQLLHNCGFETAPEISGRIKAWDRLFDLIEPALLVCDHSPTALAAARGRSFRVALVGTGFVNPPVGKWMPSLVPGRQIDVRSRDDAETTTLQVLNEALTAVGKPRAQRMSDLYARADGTFITSFKELDHFGQRQGVRYWGAWPQFGGASPNWPTTSETHNEPLSTTKRVFAYLKRSPGLTDLLSRLGSSGHSILVYGNWITPDVRQKYETSTMRLLDEPVDLCAVATQCDLAILNGTHGASAAMLLGGAPILQLPIFLEQHLLAHRVARMGAGCVVDREKTTQIMSTLDEMLGDSRFAESAGRFARTYANVDSKQQFEKLMQQMNGLLLGR